MKFTASNIARALQLQGIPLARNETRYRKHILVSGVEVTKFGNRIIFEWRDWENKINRPQGVAMVLKGLTNLGYRATEVRTTGIYVVHK